MWESRDVTITVKLPHDIAEQAEEVQKTDPEFLSRVVLYGLTRRSIYHQLRERKAAETPGLESRAGLPPPIPREEGQAILDEQRTDEETILTEGRAYGSGLEAAIEELRDGIADGPAQ